MSNSVSFNDLGDINRNQSFDDAMGKIALQAKAQQLLEARAAKRRALYDKLTKTACFLIFGALLWAGYSYRDQLHNFVTAKLDKKPAINSTTSQALNAIQANAAKRDNALEDLTK